MSRHRMTGVLVRGERSQVDHERPLATFKSEYDQVQCFYKYQLPLTNTRGALHHCRRAANKGGRSA